MRISCFKRGFFVILAFILAVSYNGFYQKTYTYASEVNLTGEGDNSEENDYPNDPKNPDDPDDKEDPNDPDDIEDPKDPKNPDDPDDKEDPDDPKDPNDPDDKEDPDDPNDPDNPDDKEDPDDPNDIEDPNDPKNPNDPDDKEDPNDPKDPNDPDDKEDPNDPKDPDDPNDIEDPNNPKNPDDTLKDKDKEGKEALEKELNEALKKPIILPTIYDYFQLLRMQLYELESVFGSNHIEWTLNMFGHDEEFIESLYYSILEDPDVAWEFLQQAYENYMMEPSDIRLNNSIMYNSSVFIPYMDTTQKRDYGDSESVNDDYIRDFTKTISSNSFRHYNIELSLTAEPERIIQSAADIMLIIDVSRGKDQLDKLKEAAIEFGKKIYGVTESNPNPSANGSRIGFLAYNGNSYIPENRLSPVYTYQEYESAVRRMDKGDNSKPNLQEQIINAKDMLDVKDGQFSFDSKKVIIFMTANDKIQESFSDKWINVGRENLINIPLPDTEILMRGFKRWTYLGFDNNIYYSGSGGQRFDAKDPHWTLGKMESQYAVAQGIDVYAIGFEVKNDFLWQLSEITWEMTNPPSSFWTKDEYTDCAPGMSVNNYIGNDRVKYGTMANITAVYKEIAEIIIKEMASSFIVTDVLSEEFEVLNDGIPITESDFGSGPIDLGKGLSVTLNETGNQVITWEVGGMSLNTVTTEYKVRVKDERIWPNGRGLNDYDDGPEVEISTDTNVGYSVGGIPSNLTLERLHTVKVDPLISGKALILDEYGNELKAILSGDYAMLTGYITSGNGDYEYQWYKRINGGDWEAIYGYSDVIWGGMSGNDIEIVLDTYPIMDIDTGSYEYLLAITDNVAKYAGYQYTSHLSFEKRQESVIQANYACNMEVFEPLLIVYVAANENSEGDNITGMFETKIKRTESEADTQWYFMGPGYKEYGYSDNIIRGIYSAEVYVPYGFEATIAYPETVEIMLIEDGDSWTGYTAYIVLTISETDPFYFYDWAWPENILKPNNTISNFPYMFIPSVMYFINGKRKKGSKWVKK